MVTNICLLEWTWADGTRDTDWVCPQVHFRLLEPQRLRRSGIIQETVTRK
jgi:hypothetical protein